MKINHFRGVYVAELQELVSVESQLSDSLLAWRERPLTRH
jgi:hypothetical protein